jgi:hypothetical protein
MVFFLAKHYLGDQMVVAELGRACKKCLRDFEGNPETGTTRKK